MGNIQCSKCGVPAAYYDYNPERMNRLSCRVSEKGKSPNKSITYEHDWVDYWENKTWYEIIFK